MQKKSFFSLVIVIIILTTLVNVLFGRYLSAKLSTLPLLNRFNILNPQTPIVITTREEVRVSDSGDVQEATNISKSKISTVVKLENNQLTVLAGAVNVASEGIFVTGKDVLTGQLSSTYIVLNDGRMALVSSPVVDSAVGLTFFKASLNSVPTAALGNSRDLKAGEKIIFLLNSTQNSLTKVLTSLVTFSQTDVQGQTFDASIPSRGFGVEVNSPLKSGQALVNVKGEVVGLWNGQKVISSDVLKTAVNLYFANPQKITRPAFGFTYSFVTKAEGQVLNLQEGVRVKSVDSFSSGLLPQDIITHVENDRISEERPLEEVLQKYKPGDKVNLTLVRGAQTLKVTLTLTEQM